MNSQSHPIKCRIRISLTRSQVVVLVIAHRFVLYHILHGVGFRYHGQIMKFKMFQPNARCIGNPSLLLWRARSMVVCILSPFRLEDRISNRFARKTIPFISVFHSTLALPFSPILMLILKSNADKPSWRII